MPKSTTEGTGAKVLAAARQQAAAKDSEPIRTAKLGSARADVGAATVNITKTPVAEIKSANTDEPVRFTVKRDMNADDGGNIKKILIYVAVVVVVGLGLLFLVENFISNNSGQQTTNDNTIAEDSNDDVQQIENTDINVIVKADTEADNPSPNDLYSTEQSALGSASNSTEGVSVAMLTHQLYQSFTRTGWELDGVTTGLPQTTVSYSAEDKQVAVSFKGIESAESLLQKIPIASGDVSSITGTQEGDVIIFTLQLREDSKYTVFIDGSNKVFVDVKTDTQLDIPVEEPEEEVEPEPEQEEEAPTEEQPPSGTNYTNEYSQSKQFVTSNASQNNLISETYYYRDDGTSFLFSWAIRGVGEQYIPNATAELITVDGKNYIEVVINNLSYDLLHSQGKAKATIGISTGGTPLVDVFTQGFSASTGKAIYRVELSRKTDYKLYSTLDYQGYQLLTLEIKD